MPGKLHEMAARAVNWITIGGWIGAVMVAALTWISSHFQPIAQYGWSGIVLFAMFGASLILALLGMGAAGWRQFRLSPYAGASAEAQSQPHAPVNLTALAASVFSLLTLMVVVFDYSTRPGAPTDTWHAPLPLLIPNDGSRDRIAQQKAISATIDFLETKYASLLGQSDDLVRKVWPELASGNAQKYKDGLFNFAHEQVGLMQELEKTRLVNPLACSAMADAAFKFWGVLPHITKLDVEDYKPILTPYAEELAKATATCKLWREAAVRALIAEQQR